MFIARKLDLRGGGVYQDIDLPKQPTMTYREMVKIMYGHPCHVHVEHGSEGHLTKLKYDSSGNVFGK